MNTQRGVSLIEALVALAVMAFGMLGIVGMQGTMRLNADIAKQRSEAVRIAQATIEGRRAFSTLSEPGSTAYGDIANQAAAAVAGTTSNTTFTRTESVTSPPGGARSRTLSVAVTWADRTGQAQSVRLSTAITGTLPELSGSLSVPAYGGPTRLPRGRHAVVPPGAIDQGDGTSRFSPPGAGSVSWGFDNVTGYITQSCVADVCTPLNARLLAGFIRFATSASQPTAADAETPPSPSFPVTVGVYRTFPVIDPPDFPWPCFSDASATLFVSYFCAVPVDTATGNRWSGRSELSGLTLILAPWIDSFSATTYRVCRYTPVRGSHPVVPTIRNEDHPKDYLDVSTSLVSQNFLVIVAGDGALRFDCPSDNAATPLMDGSTWHHQPSMFSM